MFLIDMEVGHTYLGYDIEYFCSEKSTSKILSLIIETKVKTVFELETCGFVIHQNYTISAWIDTKKWRKKQFHNGLKYAHKQKKINGCLHLDHILQI